MNFKKNLVKNTGSLRRLLCYNMENFKVLFNKNWEIVSSMLEANENLINQYFKKLDVEVYYGETNIAKPVEYLRELYNDLINDENYHS